MAVSAFSFELDLCIIGVEIIRFKSVEKAIFTVFSMYEALRKINGVTHLQPHSSPKSRSCGTGHYIPAERVRRLSEIAAVRIDAMEQSYRIVLRIGVDLCGFYMHGERIPAVLDKIVNSELMLYQQILTLAELITVQIVFCKAVYSFENQKDVFLFIGSIEFSFVSPLVILVFFGLSDVLSHKEIVGQITVF